MLQIDDTGSAICVDSNHGDSDGRFFEWSRLRHFRLCWKRPRHDHSRDHMDEFSKHAGWRRVSAVVWQTRRLLRKKVVIRGLALHLRCLFACRWVLQNANRN